MLHRFSAATTRLLSGFRTTLSQVRRALQDRGPPSWERGHLARVRRGGACEERGHPCPRAAPGGLPTHAGWKPALPGRGPRGRWRNFGRARAGKPQGRRIGEWQSANRGDTGPEFVPGSDGNRGLPESTSSWERGHLARVGRRGACEERGHSCPRGAVGGLRTHAGWKPALPGGAARALAELRPGVGRQAPGASDWRMAIRQPGGYRTRVRTRLRWESGASREHLFLGARASCPRGAPGGLSTHAGWKPAAISRKRRYEHRPRARMPAIPGTPRRW